VSVFGVDAAELNFQRDSDKIEQMLTFNGNIGGYLRDGKEGYSNSSPRRCPGYMYALEIIVFLTDRYCPERSSEVPSIPQARLEELKARQTPFQKFVLMMGKITYNEVNKYFPTASDVKHPLDTAARRLGSLNIVAAGKRSIPVYGKTP
jgi:hypothetical protein